MSLPLILKMFLFKLYVQQLGELLPTINSLQTDLQRGISHKRGKLSHHLQQKTPYNVYSLLSEVFAF